MVSLEDFVAEALIQIVRGAQRAQNVLGEAAKINPPRITKRHNLSTRTTTEEKNPLTHDVTFDVQITASDGTETKGGAGVKLHVFSAGTQGQSKSESQYVNRVQFAIPIIFDSQASRDESD